MRFVHRQDCLAVALVALACALPAAAGASSQSASRNASFCSAAKSFALSLQTAPTTQSLAAIQSQLKTNLTKLAAAKRSLVAAAPGSLKADLTNVIGLYTQLRADLVEANWNLATVAQSPAAMAGLLATEKKDKPSFAKVRQYLTKTCHY